MSRAAGGSLRHYLDNLRAAHDTDGQTDAQLLERFVASRDESAFAALLRRHGPLVLRVCRSLLRQEQDAEDAFQATFLVLALRAPSVRKGLSVGSWLYGVAQRTALAAERRSRRRKKYEQRIAPAAVPPPGDAAEELRQVLDEEMRQLPEKYRLPFLLCCLEGRSRQAAARHLGWPEGTVSSRLAEARRRLQERLARRGFALSAALTVAAAGTTVPPVLAQSATRSAVALAAGHTGIVPAAVLVLTKGVSQAMLLSKIKATAALALLLCVCAGTGVSLQPGRGAARAARAAPAPAQPTDREVREAAKRLAAALWAHRWQDAHAQTERLLAGNRILAARALGLVLRDRKLEGRTHLLSAIALKKLTEASPVLVELLNDPDRSVRFWAIDALAALGDRSAVAPLEKSLKSEKNRGVQFRIRLALARLGRPYLRYFLDGLTDRDPDRRRWCLVALGEINDPRAVPAVIKALDNPNFWDSVSAASALKRLTGVPDATITGVMKHPDGSVQTSGQRRPVQDIKKDCEAWEARHRKAVSRPIEKSPEPWDATPQPLLPGLNVSFTMTPAQVIAIHRQAGIPCQHTPERRWQNGGAHFFDAEKVAPRRSLLGPLNNGLVSLYYVFENGRLNEVQLTRTGQGRDVVAPLVGPLRLRPGKDGCWTGLDGAIVVCPSVGDAEKEMVVIRLNLGR